MPKVPLRFSLATLLLLVTIVCLSAALWSSWVQLRDTKSRLQVAEARIEKYRIELGYLTIEDFSKLHWIRIPRPGDLQWQWRVYVPEENRFSVWVADERIPQMGVAKICRGGIYLPAGEMTLHASVYRDHNDHRKFRVEAIDVPGASINVFGMEGPRAKWLDDGGWSCSAGNDRTEVPSGVDAVLLRLTAGKLIRKADEQGRPSAEFRVPDGPAPGLMVWIKDSKKAREQLKQDAAGQDGPSR
jgi:hypothetical protein